MPQAATLDPETRPTEHPHVVRTEGVCGGRPRIKDSRLAVWSIAELYLAGESAQQIAEAYSHVDPAAIYDAISYYLDHRREIDAEIEENRLENVLDAHGATLGADGVLRFDAGANSPPRRLQRLGRAYFRAKERALDLADPGRRLDAGDPLGA